jgi:hypothetical protein
LINIAVIEIRHDWLNVIDATTGFSGRNLLAKGVFSVIVNYNTNSPQQNSSCT